MISHLTVMFLVKLQAPMRVERSPARTPLARSRGPSGQARLLLCSPYVPRGLRVQEKQRPSHSSVPGAVHDARGTVAGEEDLCDLAGDGETLLKSMEMEVDLALAEVCMSFMSDAK